MNKSLDKVFFLGKTLINLRKTQLKVYKRIIPLVLQYGLCTNDNIHSKYQMPVIIR